MRLQVFILCLDLDCKQPSNFVCIKETVMEVKLHHV